MKSIEDTIADEWLTASRAGFDSVLLEWGDLAAKPMVLHYPEWENPFLHNDPFHNLWGWPGNAGCSCVISPLVRLDEIGPMLRAMLD